MMNSVLLSVFITIIILLWRNTACVRGTGCIFVIIDSNTNTSNEEEQ